jgi:TonB family protein
LTPGPLISLDGTGAAPRRSFIEPARSSAPAPIAIPPPPQAIAAPPAPATLVIAGLNPVNSPNIPRPPGSHEAGFSAGVQPNAEGDNAPSEPARITVPDLLVAGGAKDAEAVRAGAVASAAARKNLLAVLDGSVAAALARTRGEAHAARLPTVPDPRMRGRYVYTLAIQMPNVTSYSGSWTVWFADHDPSSGAAPGAIRPPVALHKVDPKYIQSAAEERVEGTVRLSAVIRKTGRVDSVELLQHLDERLDRSAREALAKWEFEPAQWNGAPIDIDAVFEIPFRLAPRPKK